jgi:hypothetical protein
MLYRKEMQAARWAHRKRGLYAAYLDHLRANVMAATQRQQISLGDQVSA